MANTRDDFSQITKQHLASRVGYRCSNPDCRKPTIGPSANVNKPVIIGVAAHITAAAKGGKRYNPSLSSHDRKHFSNGIWLCQNCAKLIDSDDNKYTVDLVKAWKSGAEQLASEEVQSASPLHVRNVTELIKLYDASKQAKAFKSEWSPSHELFSCQTNLMYSECFVGRAQECSTLMTLVDECSKVMVSGMGGIGKTELVRWIYQQCLRDNTFRHVGFLSYQGSMDATLTSAFNSPDDLPQEERTAWAWNALHGLVQKEKVLLVVDDVNKTLREDPSLQQLLNLSCTVVLTSRRKTMNGCKSFPIYALGLDDGIRLFEDIYGPISENEKGILTTIVQEIAYCHPLTIKILASIGKSRKVELSDLLLELETKKFTLAYIEDGEPVKLAEEYQKLFELSDLSIPEKKTLECFSILPYAQLPKGHCITMMQEDAGDTYTIALDMLAQKNWLEESIGNFAMHPLIAETMRFFHPFSVKEHHALLNGTTKMVSRLEDHTILQEVVPYTDVVLAIASIYYDANPEDSVFLCVLLSLKYYQAARYKLACELLEDTLKLADKTEEWGLRDIVLFRLCQTYIKVGNYAASHEIALSLVNYRELNCENGAIEIGEAYHALGTAQCYLGYFEKALESYYVALEYFEANTEDNNDDRLSNLYGDIGGVYLDLGQFENALTFLQKDVEMKEQVRTQDVELATAYNNISDLYMQTKCYDLAEENLLKATELISRRWGEQSQHLGSVYNNLANLYHSLGQDEKALVYICRTIDIESAEFERHPLLAVTYNSKAIILASLGRNDEALQANDKACAILLDTIGEENTIMGIVETTYASTYSDLRNYTEVIPHAKTACKILTRFFANDNIHLINARFFLGEALSYTGEYQGALDILKQVERSTEGNLLSAQNFRAILNLIRINTELALHEEALHLCIKALKLCRQTGQTNETRLLVYDKLLSCYTLSGHQEGELEHWLQETLNDHENKKVNKGNEGVKANNTLKTIKSSRPFQIGPPRFVSINADPLELAYVMLSSGLYHNCEFSWINPNPKHFDGIHILPGDAYLGRTITDKNIGTFSDLCRTKEDLGVDAFHCVCALDEDDTERIKLVYAGSICEGKPIIGIHLKQRRPNEKKRVGKIAKDLKTKHKEIFHL